MQYDINGNVSLHTLDGQDVTLNQVQFNVKDGASLGLDGVNLQKSRITNDGATAITVKNSTSDGAFELKQNGDAAKKTKVIFDGNTVPEGTDNILNIDGDAPAMILFTDGNKIGDAPVTLDNVPQNTGSIVGVGIKLNDDGQVTEGEFDIPEGQSLPEGTIAPGYEGTPDEDGNIVVTPVKPDTSGPAVYAIDVNAGEHGTAVADPHKAIKGKTVTITATPEEGYEVDAVSVTDRKGKAVTVKSNGDGTYSFTMPASKVDISVTFKTAEGNVTPEKPDYDNCDHGTDCPLHAFSDLNPGAWYHDGVHYVLDNGLMSGTGATTFAPNTATSRGMLVTILYRMEGEPDISGENLGYPYADVDADAYYGDAVYWARLNGIVSGYSDESFGPNDPVSREQIACILYRYAQYKGIDVSDLGNYYAYSDAGQVSAYADTPMKWAVGNKLINGTSQITLEPKASATRAQVANILMRFNEDIAK
ncbi:MAG: S-layer homology domain-containing protein [Peptococcaceae bacterium]|nr:S-layer homology domain-containing protein [Peptococcaceae bacterium]